MLVIVIHVMLCDIYEGILNRSGRNPDLIIHNMTKEKNFQYEQVLTIPNIGVKFS